MSRTIENIRLEFINDHKPFLSSYAQSAMNQVIDDCRSGTQKYRTYTDLVSDITTAYPRLMSFMVGRIDAIRNGINERVLTNEIQQQTGGGITEIREKIDQVKNILVHINATDFDEVRKLAHGIVNKLERIERELENGDLNKDVLNPDTVISDLHIVLTNLEGIEGGFKLSTADHSVHVPSRTFNDKPDDMTQFTDVVGELAESYADVIVGDNKVVKTVLRSVVVGTSIQSIIDDIQTALSGEIESTRADASAGASASTSTNTSAQVLRIVTHKSQNTQDLTTYKTGVILGILDTIDPTSTHDMGSARLAALTAEHDRILVELRKKRDRVERAVIAIEKANNDIEHYITNTDRSEYASFGSYLLPKVSTSIGLIDALSKKSLFTSDEQLVLGTIVGAFKQIPNVQYDYNDLTTAVNSGLRDVSIAMSSPDTGAVLTGVRQLQMLSDQTQHGIWHARLDRIDENFRDLQGINEFYRFYNKNMTNELVDKLNQLLATAIQNSLMGSDKRTETAQILARAVEDHVASKSLRKLMTKRIADALTSEADTEHVMRVLENARIRLFNHDDRQNSIDTSDLRSHKIEDAESAREFIHMYNRTMQSLTYPQMRGLGMPSQIRLFKKEFFTGSYTHHLLNTIFKSVDHQRDSNLEILEQMVRSDIGMSDMTNADSRDSAAGETSLSKTDMTNIYRPDFARTRSQTGGSSDVVEKLLEITQVMTDTITMYDRYDRQSEQYEMSYNKIYSYMRFLILIATNQIFADNYVVYDFINKETIEFYKRIVNRMIKDIEEGDDAFHIVFVRKYYTAVVYRIRAFLEAASHYVSEPSDIFSVTSIRSDPSTVEIRNGAILLNYFKPILESYNKSV